MPPPKITLILKGLIAVFVAPDKKLCTVGVLSDTPPGHNLEIIFRKPNAVTGVMEEYDRREGNQIADNLELEVENISQDRITLRKFGMGIDRHADTTEENKDSFSWIVDLENRELYNKQIRARRSAFTPILTFTNGELFSHDVSISHLFVIRGLFTVKDFGSVATVIGADFVLDNAPNSNAIFHNGQEAIPLPDPNRAWEIEINNDADAHGNVVSDANHYYKAVGPDLSEKERYLFVSIHEEDGGPAGPEAACFSGFLGKSQPDG